MVNSNTSFGKLKEVVVGRELNLTKRIADITFKYFYKEALEQGLYRKDFGGYDISYDILQLRRKQLDDLADKLASFGIKVYRPDEVTKVKQLKTPTFETENSSASNVRDLTLVYEHKIIETPTFIRNRYFENMQMYNIFSHKFDEGECQWIKAPQTKLIKDTIDLDDWRKDRDYNCCPSRYEMAIDAAQFLKIGKDVIVNVATYNQYKGFEWVKSFFPESNFYIIKSNDNHIDGELICLKPGVFLANPNFKQYEQQLPQKFRKWKFLYPNDLTQNIDVHGMTDIDIRLASSRGMDINVLSIDEKTVLVNKRAIGVKDILDRNGFDVVEVELDYGEIFAGGIHCSTLDLVRDDDYISYI